MAARPGAAQIDEAVLTVAPHKEERTYPELMGLTLELGCLSWQARWEVGTTGGTNVEIAVGLNHCMQRCSAFAASLLNLKFRGGADGDVPLTNEVVNDIHHE